MPDTPFAVRIVTPDGEAWSGRATSVVVPGLDGYFGVWAGHSPLVSGMEIGAVMIKTPEEHVVNFIAVSGGFVEVKPDMVTILAESAELGEDIDTNRASKAEERARERLSQHFAGVDVSRAEVALKKALNRRRIAERALAKPTQLF